jgi:3-oxoacyl-[acyl-carrier-protein] synthase III
MRTRVAGKNGGRPRLAGGSFGPEWLHMNGPGVFTFTLNVVPKLVADLLAASGLAIEDVDMVVPHQANAFMLESLRKRIRVPPERFFVDLRKIGNTVSATIPIALAMAAAQGRLKPGARAMLLGFGIGLSWGGAMVRWHNVAIGMSDAASTNG